MIRHMIRQLQGVSFDNPVDPVSLSPGRLWWTLEGLWLVYGITLRPPERVIQARFMPTIYLPTGYTTTEALRALQTVGTLGLSGSYQTVSTLSPLGVDLEQVKQATLWPIFSPYRRRSGAN